jgi:hypothetical protein
MKKTTKQPDLSKSYAGPLHYKQMKISPSIPWSQPPQTLIHTWLYLQPENKPPPEAGITLLHRLTKLKQPLGYCIMVIHTGESRDIIAQLSYSEEDHAVVETAVKKAFHGAHLRPGNDILTSTFKTIRNTPEQFTDFEFDFRDILRVGKYTPKQAAVSFLSVGSSLLPGEILFQDCVIYPEETKKGIPKFRALLRYGVVCRKKRRDDLLSAITHTYGPELPFHSWSDYKRSGISGKRIFAMFLKRRAHRYGSIMSIKMLGLFFFLTWAAPAFEASGINVPLLQGNPPHPLLLNGGVWIGYSRFDKSDQPVFFPDACLEQSMLISGSIGTGKSTLLERITQALMIRNNPSNTILLIEKKGELSPRLLGMVPDGRIDDVMYYAPAIYPFNCNILDLKGDALTSSLFLSAFGRAVASRDLLLTPNVMLMLRNAMRALVPWGRKATIMHIHHFFANEIFRKDVLRRCHNHDVKDFIDNIFPLIVNTSKSALFNKLDFFKDNPVLSSTCQQNNMLDFIECMKNNRLVFADLSGLSPEIVSDLGTFLFARAAVEGYVHGPRLLGDNWFTIILDEFHEFIEEDTLNSVLTQGRSRHTACILAFQTIKGQLDRQQESTILGNCPVKVCFRMEHDDAIVMGKLLNIPPAEIASLENYHAYLKVGTLPAIKIRAAEPLPSSDQKRIAVIDGSQKRYEASLIDPFDPFQMLNVSAVSSTNKKKKIHHFNTI